MASPSCRGRRALPEAKGTLVRRGRLLGSIKKKQRRTLLTAACGGGGGSSVESSMDDISSAFGGMNFEDVGADAAATSQGNKVNMSRRRTPRGGERIRAFNPRAPNFLPVVPDPDAEKVNAEEWMVDYALRRTVNKLARAQKRKVEMLVQAFETVLPPHLGEKKSDDKKSFACN
ncbi:hypothetical protein TRIUR3_20871 [Triticum urartu]|uniref:Calmodulin-binding domain-containing protein n=1 Tax=Triticum urartu TaxID=4572 RepID=M7YUG9_TRIUA|nr:hypothetical protein TRIUR3_20871 [Triticum urartu]